MRLRPPGSRPPYRTAHSELFEAAYFGLEQQFPFLREAHDELEWIMQRDPLANSEPAPAFTDRDMRLAVTPRTTRYPGLRVLLEVQEELRRVYFWHLSVRV